MRFVDLLRENAEWESDYGIFSRFCLDRASITYYIDGKMSYMRDVNPAYNDFPIFSNEARTIFEWVQLRCPQFTEVYHRLADEYRSMKEGRRFEDMREPEKPEKTEVDFAALRRATKKKYIYGKSNGQLTERNYERGIQETD